MAHLDNLAIVDGDDTTTVLSQKLRQQCSEGCRLALERSVVLANPLRMVLSLLPGAEGGIFLERDEHADYSFTLEHLDRPFGQS
jgi:hypothetical protein